MNVASTDNKKRKLTLVDEVKIEREEDIVFDERTHSYTYKKQAVRHHVTRIINSKFQKFDGKAVCDENFTKWKHNASSKYYACIADAEDDEAAKAQIQKKWQKDGEDSCSAGKAMHACIEALLNKEMGYLSHQAYLSPSSEEIRQYLEWKQCGFGKDLTPVRSELSLVHLTGGGEKEDKQKRAVLAGQADALFRDQEGRFVLVDWKRVKDPIDPNGKIFRYGKEADLAASVPDRSFDKYSLQLAMYAEMLKESGINVDERRFIVRFHPNVKDNKAETERATQAHDGVARALMASCEAPPI